MTLPRVDAPREKVSVGGEEIEVRGLTRQEGTAVRARKGDAAGMEVLLIAYGTDEPEDDVRQWWEQAPDGVVEPVVQTIVRLSGLGEGAQKSGGSEVPER